MHCWSHPPPTLSFLLSSLDPNEHSLMPQKPLKIRNLWKSKYSVFFLENIKLLLPWFVLPSSTIILPVANLFQGDAHFGPVSGAIEFSLGVTKMDIVSGWKINECFLIFWTLKNLSFSLHWKQFFIRWLPSFVNMAVKIYSPIIEIQTKLEWFMPPLKTSFRWDNMLA